MPEKGADGFLLHIEKGQRNEIELLAGEETGWA